MSDDTTLSAAPEPNPGCKSGDLEPPAEVFDGNIHPETRQTEGDVEVRWQTARPYLHANLLQIVGTPHIPVAQNYTQR